MFPPNPRPEVETLGTHELRDGRVLHLRHLQPDDDALIAEAIRTASPDVLHHRFFTPVRDIPRTILRRYLRIDPERDVCVVAQYASDRPRLAGGARFVREAGTDRAEVALTVHDQFQREGLGRALLGLLARLARERGIRTFTATVLADNAAMLGLLRQAAPDARRTVHAGVVTLEWKIGPLPAP